MYLYISVIELIKKKTIICRSVAENFDLEHCLECLENVMEVIRNISLLFTN